MGEPECRGFHLTAGSPGIDSAHSGASGQPTADADGNPRLDDPGSANTGAGPRAYDDRGAYEFDGGSLDHIVISPASATIVAGGSQAYTAEGFDSSGNSFDVTGATTFSIAPNGSCSGNVCTATATGSHTVTGTDAGAIATASLSVTPGGLDHLVLSPASATITSGGSQAYTAEGRDQYDNSLGDVTASTTFSIAPNGSCTGASCTASVAGPHTVTGTKTGKTGTASLQVTAGAGLDHIVISPASATIVAGGSQTYTAEGFDASNNSLGDVTASTTFSIAPNGSCSGNVCTATATGSHTVTGTDAGAIATASLSVTPGGLDHLVLSPASATITSGGSQAYTAEGRDQYDNSLGDVTASTTFSIAPNGSCTGASCTASVAGPHTVTGTKTGKTGTASLQVTPGGLDHLVLSPASATIAAGGSQTYTAEGFDASNNSLGDVTASTTFTISPEGSCTGASCTASVAGPHTVTGTKTGKTGIASLQVTAGSLDHIVISPASATIVAGGSQAYTAEGFDAPATRSGRDRSDDLLHRSERIVQRQRVHRDRYRVAHGHRHRRRGDRHRLAERDPGRPGSPRALAGLGHDHLGRLAGLHRRGTRPIRQLARRRDRLDDLLDRPERVLHRRELHRLGGRAAHGHGDEDRQDRHRLLAGDRRRRARPHRDQPRERRRSSPAARRPTPPRASMPRTTRSAT